MDQILLIGGGGYVGSVIAEYFLKRDFAVSVFDKFTYEHSFSVDRLKGFKNFKLYDASMDDYSALDKAVDGKINLVVRYGSKLLEFAKGKNAIELASESEVADVLAKVREAVKLGELDALIEKQAQYGRPVTQKNK